MGNRQDPPIVTQAEIEAALAEAEAEAARIPSLEEGARGRVVPVPVETDLPRRTASRIREPEVEPAAAPARAPIRPAQTTGPADRQATPSLLRRLLARLLEASHLAGLGRVLYWFIDGLLWTINRPFERISPETRRLVGWVAVVTLTTSLLAGLVLPKLWPRDDPLSRLARWSAARSADRPTDAAPLDWTAGG